MACPCCGGSLTPCKNRKSIASIAISIENPAIVREALAEKDSGIAVMASESSAPLSAIVAIRKSSTFPVLITTADHRLADAGDDRLFLRTRRTQFSGFFRRAGHAQK